jgi:hypothetical protein
LRHEIPRHMQKLAREIRVDEEVFAHGSYGFCGPIHRKTWKTKVVKKRRLLTLRSGVLKFSFETLNFIVNRSILKSSSLTRAFPLPS